MDVDQFDTTSLDIPAVDFQQSTDDNLSVHQRWGKIRDEVMSFSEIPTFHNAKKIIPCNACQSLTGAVRTKCVQTTIRLKCVWVFFGWHLNTLKKHAYFHNAIYVEHPSIMMCGWHVFAGFVYADGFVFYFYSNLDSSKHWTTWIIELKSCAKSRSLWPKSVICFSCRWTYSSIMSS